MNSATKDAPDGTPPILPPAATHQHEDGTTTQEASPAAELSVRGFQTFVSFIITLAIFGASIFSIIVTEMQDPKGLSANARFDLQTVRVFLALAWTCFVLALAMAGLASSVLTMQQERQKTLSKKWHGRWKKFGLAASLLMQTTIVLAFLFLSLALVAYVEPVGWLCVVMAAGCLGVIFVLWINDVKSKVN